MSKKIIIIGLVIVLLATSGVLFYLNVFSVRDVIEIPDFGSGFPNSDTINTPTENTPTEDPLPALTDTEAVFDRLKQITKRSVAGYTAFKRAGDIIIRYAEQGTGHIYEYNMNTGLDQKISNKTIQGLINATWGKGGNVFISQELIGSKIKTTHYSFEDDGVYVFEETLSVGDRGPAVLELQKFLNTDPDTRIAVSGAGSLGNETTYFGEKTKNGVIAFQEKHKSDTLEFPDESVGTGILDGSTRTKINSLRRPNVGQNLAITEKDFTSVITKIVVSPSGEKLFYLAKDVASEGVIGISSTIDLENAKQIFSSPISEWVISWDNEEKIIVSSTPSADIFGITYALDIVSGTLTKIAYGDSGQTVRMAPDGAHIFKTISTPDSFESTVVNILSKSVHGITRTLPEKCVWFIDSSALYCGVPQTISENNYPDVWYRGEVSFSDSFWELGVESPTQSIIYNPVTNTGVAVDVHDLTIDPTGQHLMFRDKRSLGLWTLRL